MQQQKQPSASGVVCRARGVPKYFQKTEFFGLRVVQGPELTGHVTGDVTWPNIIVVT